MKPDAVAKQQHTNEVHARQVSEAYHRAFMSPDGQAVLTDLREYFKTSEPAFQNTYHGPYDPILAALRDGQRRVYLYIEQQIKKATAGDDGGEPKVTVNKP